MGDIKTGTAERAKKEINFKRGHFQLQSICANTPYKKFLYTTIAITLTVFVTSEKCYKKLIQKSLQKKCYKKVTKKVRKNDFFYVHERLVACKKRTTQIHRVFTG